MTGPLEPTIERAEDFRGNATVYRLHVPLEWLITARWPRVQLSWWLMRMIWQEEV